MCERIKREELATNEHEKTRKKSFTAETNKNRVIHININMKKRLALFLSLLLCSGCERVSSEVKNHNERKIDLRNSFNQENEKSCVTFNFHYLETQNVLYSSTIRNVEIFLDENAFSEENLKKLFVYISEKNPEPKNLIVKINTNWKQLDFPSDCPGQGASNMPERPDKYDYLQAIYQRRARYEYFDYSPEIKVDQSKFKRVILKNETEKAQ